MKNFSLRSLLIVLVISTFSFAQAPKISPEDQAVLDRISSDSLKGHLSFIASDLLEGRDTPSRGQDIAAEYIAAQFRRAGLEPVGDDGYFQTANWVQPEGVTEGFSMTLSRAKMRFKINPEQVSFSSDQALNIARGLLFKVDYKDQKSWEALTEAQVKGKVIFTEQALDHAV